MLPVASAAPRQETPSLAAAPQGSARRIDPLITFDQGPEEVLVCLLDETGRVPADASVMDEMVQAIGPPNVIGTFGHDAILARLGPAEVRALAGDPRVEGIASNRPRFHAQLPDSIQIVHAIEAWEMEVAGTPLTGQGYSVALLDTGIDFSHPDLAAKNVVGCNVQCVVPGDGDCFPDCAITDCSGHGTRTGGIAGADGTVQGIGVGVGLVALKIYTGCSGSGATVADVRRGIDWAVDNAAAYGIAVISMSIGDGVCWTGTCDGAAAFIPIRNSVNAAVAAGIAVTAASGNNGCTSGINAPACLSNAIPVSATRKVGDVWSSSNYGPQVKVFAPGAGILTTTIGGGHGNSWGTSMATPMVASALAIMRQFLDGIGASMAPLDMEQVLFDTGDAITGLPFASWRRIDLQAAIESLVDQLVAPGDIDVDGTVGISDLLLLLGAWGPCPDCADCPADLDGDCTVGITDLLTLLGNWG
jgi:subtilisin family serine protease